MRSFIVLLSFFAATNIYGTEESPREFVMCKHDGEVRTLSILMNPENHCVTHYTKNGKDEIIARAKSPALCHDRLKQLQGILKSANYNCRSIAKVQVMTGSELAHQ